MMDCKICITSVHVSSHDGLQTLQNINLALSRFQGLQRWEWNSRNLLSSPLNTNSSNNRPIYLSHTTLYLFYTSEKIALEEDCIDYSGIISFDILFPHFGIPLLIYYCHSYKFWNLKGGPQYHYIIPFYNGDWKIWKNDCETVHCLVKLQNIGLYIH